MVEKKEEKVCHPEKGKEGNVYINFDDIILNCPVPFEHTRAGREVLKRLGHGGCCCCCCCCCHDTGKAPAESPTTESRPSVTLDVTWELKVNVGDAYTPSSVLIMEIDAEFSWNATGSQGVTVDIQATTLDLSGNPTAPFPTWTDIITNQRPVGIARWHMERQVIGNTIRFQARAKDQAGNEAYSNVISVSPGTISL
ncbi:MAG: hypothetical protein JRJ42_02805 [Deltaproteobacteria bacterium]|nr:hypothetical protein [Deltaproteobacteria bacterium]MBW2019718.1 hypothetical protein [Deltaproteobacteria bacterium]MBW2073918.1 hypothetical protein [Deltaproteobacteria bacterium]